MKAKLLQPARRMIADICDRQNSRRAARKTAAAPEVGIFFVVDGKNLFIDGTPLPQASGYGDFLIHEADHYGFWDQLLASHAVPGSEYDEIPRGRVVYSKSTLSFTLFADCCILKDEVMVEKIADWMNLPSKTKVETDPHYRCPGCMKAARTAALLDTGELSTIR